MESAETYRKLAAQHEQDAEDSFDRSDTDGFLSQWASGISAQKATRNAEIAEKGGKAEFRGLYCGDERIMAKIVEGQFGNVWLLDDAAATQIGRRFIPTGEKSRVQRQFGLSERTETQAAFAVIQGSGRGLSGNVWIATIRRGDQWGRDAELVK